MLYSWFEWQSLQLWLFSQWCGVRAERMGNEFRLHKSGQFVDICWHQVLEATSLAKDYEAGNTGYLTCGCRLSMHPCLRSCIHSLVCAGMRGKCQEPALL